MDNKFPLNNNGPIVNKYIIRKKSESQISLKENNAPRNKTLKTQNPKLIFEEKKIMK